MEPSSAPSAGSIDDVRERLLLWCRRSQSGFARVEFTSENARREVVEGLKTALSAAGIPLHEVTLAAEMDTPRLVDDLVQRLATLPPGVVSIDGFASALPLDSEKLAEALYRFNLKRERLGDSVQRQIWWMPTHFAEVFVRVVPDLDSWFLVKLRLTQIAGIEPSVSVGMIVRAVSGSRLDPREVRRLVGDYIARHERELKLDLSAGEPEELLVRAVTLLRQSGLNDEAIALERRFRGEPKGYVAIFLSAVSAEFRSYRDALLRDLDRPNVTVKVQEDFIATGSETLDKLDDYIRQCDAVIHLVGDMTGASAKAGSVALIRRRYPDFATRLPALAGFLDDGAPALSYTQWEAWLALYHRKTLLIAAPAPDAPRDPGYRLDENQLAAQQAHLERLRSAGRYVEIRFANADRLAKEILRARLQEIIARAGPPTKPRNLPLSSIGDLFKGREPLLGALTASLGIVPETPASPLAAMVLGGMGGVGKTRLAIEYAWRRAADYAALLFVNADSPESLQRNLAALCARTVLDLPEQADTDQGKQHDAVLDWLCRHPGWLLILDNIDSEAAAAAVEALLPQLAGGHALLTSRLANWSGSIAALALDVLSPEAAADFLLARTDDKRRRQADDAVQALHVAKELDGLALALEQAGAYIAQRRLGFTQYLAQWQAERDKVLAWYDPRLMQYPKSVAITWQTSFDQLGAPARRLLERLAWLAPDAIPESLLDVAVPGVDAAEADPFAALAELESYSLVKRAADTPSFSVHRLVQEVTRRTQRDDPAHGALVEALHWIDAAFAGDPDDVRAWPLLEPLAPHVRAVATHADRAGIAAPTARLLNVVGLLLKAKALYAEAEPLLRRALAIDQASFGDDHPEVAIDLNNLAQLLTATNRLAEAEPLMRRALAIDQASLGDDHPRVAAELNNLAGLLHASNRLTEAESLLRRALAIDQASFGDDHPNVATSLNNLAGLLQATNRLIEAEPLMRRALAIDQASFGDDHPNVARDLNNLAQLFRATNRLIEAEPLMRRALAIDQASFGDDHPRVAHDLNNLAQLLQATNRLAEAEPLMRRALQIFVASLGIEHPTTLGVRGNFLGLLQAIGRTDAEIAAELAALVKRP